MSNSIFKIDDRDLKKYSKMLKDSPNDFKKMTAGVLNSLAFDTRKNDIQNINQSMIVRNKRFVESNLRVDKTRPVSINQQIANAYSVERPGFHGWKEQQGLPVPERKRGANLVARGGNKRGSIKPRYRLTSGNKFYKPEQFQGRDLKSRYQFMMRVLGTRGGGTFLLNDEVPTKRGALGKGLYSLKNGKIQRLQNLEDVKPTARNEWRTRSLRQLQNNNHISRVWADQLAHYVRKNK